MNISEIIKKEKTIFGGYGSNVFSILSMFGYSTDREKINAMKKIIFKAAEKYAKKDKKLNKKRFLKYFNKKIKNLALKQVSLKYISKKISEKECKVLILELPFGLERKFILDHGSNNGNIIRKLKKINYWTFLRYSVDNLNLIEVREEI